MSEETEIVKQLIMPCEITEDLAGKIKIDLTTSSLTQAQIGKKNNVGIIAVNSINTGRLFPNVEPITPTQMGRKAKEAARLARMPQPAQPTVSERKPRALVTQQSTAKELILDLADVAELDWFVSWLHKKPEWPKVVIIPTIGQTDKTWAVEMLKDRIKRVTLDLAKCTLIINALETGDYSDLSEKMIQQIESDTNHTISELAEASKEI